MISHYSQDERGGWDLRAKIAGADQASALLDEPPVAEAVLSRLADDVIAYCHAALDRGVDGFFYACQQASDETPALATRYARTSLPADRKILDAIRDRAEFVFLHLHGGHPPLVMADDLPVDVVNWEDRETGRSLAYGLGQTKKAVCGGLDRMATLRDGHGGPAEAAADVQALAETLPQTRAIIGPGCVLLQDTAQASLDAALESARGAKP